MEIALPIATPVEIHLVHGDDWLQAVVHDDVQRRAGGVCRAEFVLQFEDQAVNGEVNAIVRLHFLMDHDVRIRAGIGHEQQVISRGLSQQNRQQRLRRRAELAVAEAVGDPVKDGVPGDRVDGVRLVVAEQVGLPAGSDPRNALVLEVEVQQREGADRAAYRMGRERAAAQIDDADVLMAAGEHAALGEIDGELAGGVKLLHVCAVQLQLDRQGMLGRIGVEDG